MNYLAITLLLGVAVGVTYGLKCYDCDDSSSFVEKGKCGDTYVEDKDQLMMCNATAGEVYCRKEKTGVNGAYTSVERHCTDQCEERNDLYIRRVTCCQTDGCNSASGAVASVCLVLAAVFGKLL